MGMYYIDQQSFAIRLLQSKRAKLSTFKSNEGKIRAIINCSYFSNEGYVIGRNQGDEKNDTVDQTNFAGNNIVIFKDESFKIGLFNSWDYTENVVAGFCPAAIYRNNNLEVSKTINEQGQWVPNNMTNRTAICYDGKYHFCLGTNINVDNIIKNIKAKYTNLQWVALLDSGKSTEAIEDGKIVVQPSAGEQTMFNGLAFIELEQPTPEPSEYQKPIFPTKSTWVSQPMDSEPSHKGLKAIDFGTWSKASLKRLGLSEDYDYPITAPFDCRVVYRDSESKGALLVLESLSKVEFSNGDKDYCSVCIGHSNDTPALNTTFKQNDLVCHFGKAGTSAKHLHLEVIKGRFSEIYKNKAIATCKQSVGYVYCLENTIDPNKCLYLTEDTYIEDNPYDWKIIKSSIDEKDKKIKELEAQVDELNNTLKIVLNTNDELKELLIDNEKRFKQIVKIANNEEEQ